MRPQLCRIVTIQAVAVRHDRRGWRDTAALQTRTVHSMAFTDPSVAWRRLRRSGMHVAAVLAAGLLMLAGCATSQLNAQWSDPEFAGKSLRGARVLVACQAVDPTLRRVCADRSAARLAALGAKPFVAPEGSDVDLAMVGEALLQTARGAGAVALWRTTLTPDAAAAPPGPSIGIGIGGFGGSYRGGGGIGFGVSGPIGGTGALQVGYSASASLTDVASGQLMWSARATAPPSSDLSQQMNTLSQLLADAARQSGLFPS
jgi:hypothetical protein